MHSIWILAAGEPAAENTEVVTMEPADQKTQTMTGAPDSPPTGGPEDGTGTAKPNPWLQMLPFIVIIVVMYLLLFRGPRRKQQEHQKMVSSLKKNDRVRTIGGIYGTVVEVRQDDIILKIDENTNTKIHIIPSAIGTVLSEEKK
jgi:preprotein translocase subunit YajC